MKNIFFIVALCFVYISNAQTLSYNDVGVLFTNEQINGTARYNAMSGAFGALGGDLSAIGINPAGAAVFLKSEGTFTVDFRGTDTQANYYGNNTFAINDEVNFSQTGGVFVFRNNPRNNSGWGKVAFAFDYSKVNDFKNFWYAEGNSNYPTWISDPYDENQTYLYTDGQYFENLNDGRNNKFAFTLASQYENKLYVGASFNSYNIDYYQLALIEEYNHDNNENYMDVSSFQELVTYGHGYSFSLGLIAKPINNVRLGFAYQSPIWYNLNEKFLEYDTELYVTNIDDTFVENSGVSRYNYKLRSPSKYTGSFAYVFDKFGLISIDYIYQNYSNIQLSNGNFSNENKSFNTDLNSVSAVRFGTEWRVQKLSLRGGYHFEQSPYKNSISSDDVSGYSLGFGYNFGNVKLDFAYLHSSNTGVYDFYPQYEEVDATELDFKTNRYTITLALNL